jgi:hypothetical protein
MKRVRGDSGHASGEQHRTKDHPSLHAARQRQPSVAHLDGAAARRSRQVRRVRSVVLHHSDILEVKWKRRLRPG